MSKWLALAKDTSIKSISLCDSATKPDKTQPKGEKGGFCPLLSHCHTGYKEKDTALASGPLLGGTVISKGKHLGKTAMQNIAMCQAIEHGANTRIDFIKELGWGITVTDRYINTLIRSGHISESDNGILSLNNITYQLIDRLIKAGHLVVKTSKMVTDEKAGK